MSEPKSIETIFLEAVELPGEQRQAFIERCCAGNQEMQAAVERLVAADAQAGDLEFLRSNLFTKTPAEDVAVTEQSGEFTGEEDRFRVIRTFCEGGLGEVLLAHDRQLDRDVALKRIKPRWQDNLEARQRFVQEAKVTGRLEHPGIVPVYAMGTWADGQQYYAMRFIHGQTMKDAIAEYHAVESDPSSRDAKTLLLRDLLTRFVDVCNTIQYAHSKRVLHRDIKPSNIMVGPYGETLVVDWGLAKLLDEPEDESMTANLARELNSGSGSTPTQAGRTVGTPQYMSPEQAGGKLDEIGTRTDVYLLGSTLYQILTGQPPHHGESIPQLLQQISQGAVKRPREVLHSIPAPLESICLAAMARRPTDRYANPERLADDVNRWMADQGVSVHADNLTAGVNRWVRRHRTATSTIAVATVLLAVGGVLGSILWNVAKVREIQALDARRTKKLELEVKDRQRIAELSIAAEAAEKLAKQEIERDRYSSALGILQAALSTIDSEPTLIQQADSVQEKANRISSVVDFYRLSDIVEQQNTLSRDTKALMACTAALKGLGIWDRPDWWTALPDQELSPRQIDTLRWDVYQQLMLMDAMLVKRIGLKLTGQGKMGASNTLLRAANRILTSNIAKSESQAVLVVSDRIDRFRMSESTRLYRSVGKMRLGQGRRLQGKDLGPTRNSADAHSLAVLSMIAAIDPSFEMMFRDYQGEDSLLTARNLFRRSVAMRPNYYGAHLGLGQVEYLIAKRKDDLRWEDLAPSLQAFGQCITLLPDRCFAYADRSSVYRFQAKLVQQDERYSSSQRQQLFAERLRWSLEDARRAMQFYDDHPWIGWQGGLVFAEMGQVDRAIGLWIRTAIDTYPLAEIADTTIIQVDDLRGRAEIGDWLNSKLHSPTHELQFDIPSGFIALAGVRLNQGRTDAALQAIDSALELHPERADALALRATVRLREKAVATAETDFKTAYRLDPNHPLAAFGLAVCLEHANKDAEANAMFANAERLSLTGENRAAAALGQCRTAAVMDDLSSAEGALRRAIDAEPSCDLMSVARPIAVALRDLKSLASTSPQRIIRLTEFAKSIAAIPRATQNESMAVFDLSQPASASLLNGGFELGSMRYWNAASGAQWDNTFGLRSSATVTRSPVHSGGHALRIHVQDDASTATERGRFDDAFAQTGQEFTVVAGASYEIACWVKADELTDQTIRLVDADGNVVIAFSGGTYDWRRVTGKFTLTNAPEGNPIQPGTIAPYQLRLQASGSGTLWLDDVSCKSKPSPP